jgi:hypothetical protein
MLFIYREHDARLPLPNGTRPKLKKCVLPFEPAWFAISRAHKPRDTNGIPFAHKKIVTRTIGL